MTRLSLLVLLLANAAAAEAPRDFAFGIALTTEADAPFYRVELPAAVYEGAVRPDRGDLRVFNADEAMVPFAYLPAANPVRERKSPVSVPMFPLRVEQADTDLNGLSLSMSRTAAGTTLNLTTRDGRAVAGDRLAGYVLDTSALEEPIAGLVLAWAPPAHGLTTRVRVEAGDDLASWRTIASDAPLVDLEYAGRHLTRDRIELPPTKAKYLRLSWAQGQAPLELSAARVDSGERVIEAPRRWIEATGAPIADHDGDYEFDLKGAFPIDRVGIDLPEINSVVPAQIYVRATAQDPWRPVATLVVYRLRQADAEVASSPAAVNAGSNARYWMLRVDPNSGGLGSGRPRIRAGWLPQELVFAARGGAPFTIAYGSSTATSSALPIATLVPGYGTTSAPPIGAATVQAGALTPLGGPDRLRKGIDGKRLLLWATLVLGVALLGWMAWRLSRQLAVSGGDDQPVQKPRTE